MHLSAGLTSCAALRSSHWAECQGLLQRRGSYVFPKCAGKLENPIFGEKKMRCLLNFLLNQSNQSIGKVNDCSEKLSWLWTRALSTRTCRLHGHADWIKLQPPKAGAQDIRLGRFFRFSSCLGEHKAHEMHSGSGSQATDWGMSKLWRVQQPSQAPHPTVPQGIASLGQDAISCTPRNADWGTRA
jgi:hypothetical protein